MSSLTILTRLINDETSKLNDNFNWHYLRSVYKLMKGTADKFLPNPVFCRDAGRNVISFMERTKSIGPLFRMTAVTLPILQKIKSALKMLRNRKAPGVDGIPAELLKKRRVTMVTKLFELICSDDTVMED